ncbi:MAG: hypothetical protein JNM17_11295 [Archangium sp.]|nr:hypothetical protein [Archangium sp.]
MRSRLAAAAVVLVSVAVLVTASIGRAGERAPAVSVPVKEAVEKMKQAKAPKGAVGLVRFYGEVLDGKSVEFYFSDFSNAGRANEQLAQAIGKSSCGKLDEAKLKTASALFTEFGTDFPPELRGYVLGQQGKPDQAAPLLLKALEEMQPLDRCVFGHPDDAGEQMGRIGTWAGCFTVLVPRPSKADAKKLEAIRSKAFQCMAETAGTVG